MPIQRPLIHPKQAIELMRYRKGGMYVWHFQQPLIELIHPLFPLDALTHHTVTMPTTFIDEVLCSTPTTGIDDTS